MIALVIAAVLLLAALEGFLRVVVGLGDPPLLVPDDAIGYVNRPGRHRRFGNDVEYNAYGMRSPPIAPKSADEIRILVCGDSIVHGTARVSQPQLATAFAQTELSATLQRPVSVLNLAACGWGPANVLAYLSRYGTFDADLALLVFNSDDLVEPLTPQRHVYPTVTPRFALQEAVQLAEERWFSRSRKGTSSQQGSSLPNIKALLTLLHDRGVRTTVLYHPGVAEAQDGSPSPSYQLLAECAAEHAVRCVSLEDCLLEELGKGNSPWRPDGLHLTARGQALLGDALVREAASIVEGPDRERDAWTP